MHLHAKEPICWQLAEIRELCRHFPVLLPARKVLDLEELSATTDFISLPNTILLNNTHPNVKKCKGGHKQTNKQKKPTHHVHHCCALRSMEFCARTFKNCYAEQIS